MQRGPSAQGSGSIRQRSVLSKQGNVTDAQKKGTWRLPEPESSFYRLGGSHTCKFSFAQVIEPVLTLCDL